MARLAGALALFVVLVATPLWSDLALVARTRHLSYAERRDRLALGFPADEVEGLLARELAPEAPVALAPALGRDERMRQRLTELLYPRPVDAASPFVLERPGGAFALRGATRSEAGSPAPPQGARLPARFLPAALA